MAYTYSKIATYTVGSGGIASIDFLNIPQTYTDLVLKLSGRSTRSSIYGDNILLKLNGSTSGFTYRRLGSDGSSASSQNYTSGYLSLSISTASMTANTFGNAEIYFPNYSGSTYKSISTDSVGENNGSTVNSDLNATLWSNTSPITSISLVLSDTGSNFTQYSSAHLYGIKNEV